jgi:hypothetical protein
MLTICTADNGSLWHADNHIGDDGAKHLIEALKLNSTLQELNLRCMYDMSSDVNHIMQG